MRRATASAVPVYKMSWSVSSQFTFKVCVAAENHKKT